MTLKVCVVSGSRAEYGILKRIMSKIESDPDLTLQLLVTGAHLTEQFGMTVNEIEADGFGVDKQCLIPMTSDSAAGTLMAMGKLLELLSEAMIELSPDLLMVVGDRYEIFTVAAAATVLHIPIAHIHGGEVTLGAIDDVFRHSITKMAHLHFTATPEYRTRIIQMGENPEDVSVVGAPALESLALLEYLPKAEVESQLGISFGKKNILVAYHPETRTSGNNLEYLEVILTAIDLFPDLRLIFTGSNADEGGRRLNSKIQDYVKKNPSKAVFHDSLGQRLFFSTLRLTDGILGNSSSGIIEAPSLGVGTINVGIRQKGRMRGSSVIDCQHSVEAVADAIEQLLSSDFKTMIRGKENPYAVNDTSDKVIGITKEALIQGFKPKRYFDWKFEESMA